MNSVQSACEVLKNGGVIIHATEAVLGLAASIYDFGAFNKLSSLKNRPFSKKFIVLVSDVKSASDLVDLPLRALPSSVAIDAFFCSSFARPVSRVKYS